MTHLRIDEHAHLWTTRYLDRLERRLGKADTGTQRGIGADATEADLDRRFALMDRAGIDLQVLSVAPQSPHLMGEPDAVALARAANESYAELVARFPGGASGPSPRCPSLMSTRPCVRSSTPWTTSVRSVSA
ncbi:hypothetical protein ACFWDI_27820 [Streptomyces sp. NPDC060064]|uniref:hypothetical protein n=1 Tax=Streptomyces sp. NPDC060064 TaxID=3347049 RepID=UPI003692ED78